MFNLKKLAAAVSSIALICPALSQADDLASWIARPIIDAQLPLQEVQEYCEARVPPMPQVESVEAWERYATKARQRVFDTVVFRGEAAKWRDAKLRVEDMGVIDGGPEYRIRKLRYEAVPGMWIPALLYEPKKLEGEVPVVLNVNGHDRKNGKAADYKQTRCINQAKRGMLALNVEWLGMGQLQRPGNVHYQMNQLDLCGTSGLAPFYLSMSRGLDVLLKHKNADSKRVAVAGLSGGGWQTIIISALDERVTLSDPVAGYSSFRTRARYFSDLGDSEQTPVDLAVAADYAQLTAMRAPRPTLLTFNAKDNCCFAAPHALPPLMDAAMPIYRLYEKPGSLRWHVNHDPGNHNFGIDNRQALYRMFKDFFYADDSDFDATEIECESELKTKDELLVEIPDDNATFHSLALKLSESLPRAAPIPDKPEKLSDWRTRRRGALRRILRTPDYSVAAEVAESGKTDDGVKVIQWKLNISDRWTVPAVSLEKGESNRTVILIADEGRKGVVKQAETLLTENARVVLVDPFYFGESKIASRDFLFGLMISAIGDRPLGIQAAQINAIGEWIGQKFTTTVELRAVGHRTSLIALSAAASTENGFADVRLSGSLKSLRDVITNDIMVNQQPELFCLALLEEFDIPQLIALAGAERVKLVAGTE